MASGRHGGKEGEEFDASALGGRRMDTGTFDAAGASRAVENDLRALQQEAAAAGRSGGEFYQDDHDVMRSVGMAPTMAAAGGVPYRHLAAAPQAQFSVGRLAGMGPTVSPGHFTKAAHKHLPTDAAAIATDASAFTPANTIHPPALPQPPYPLERHAYGVAFSDGADSGARTVVEQINSAFKNTLVDFESVEAECRWECCVTSSGKRVDFHVRLHKASAQFCVEFQRRKGCSIVFNMAVSGVLKHLGKDRAKTGMRPLVMFERSEEDKKVAPSQGFFVESFDIPDVPLDLSFMDLPTPKPATRTVVIDKEKEDAMEREVSDGVKVLLDMAASDMEDMAVEGTAGLAILSKPEGREALLSATRVKPVAEATATALRSKIVDVRVAAATLLANLAEDQRSHTALAEAGAIILAHGAATTRHTAFTAQVRRECLRALVNFCGGPQRAQVESLGGLQCAKKVIATCHGDVRMRISADRLQKALA